ncbi:DUF6438 domain-containing protein [Flavobacterium phragmitis]|uniref:DUF6438 domain-containing protein n=1 Tax=Flavobacterium phragmitis TaxID=739143 RepID=A0A1I1KQA0_9FLAO|nr:hypothetical protein [Flavobacterium phragmitis]SFC63026.1 hypothetical protein SAMN05216297_101508 [Flavobacterium phragmitis]
MKRQFIILGILFLFLCCTKKEKIDTFPFDEFVFAGEALHSVFCIKFTKSDTVYYQRIFPEPIENSYAVINLEEKAELNKLLRETNFEKFDTVYANNVIEDEQTYLINVSNLGKRKSIYLYAREAPKKLDRFIKSLGEIKGKLHFMPTNKKVDFGDLKSILPPPLPPMPVKKVN